MVFHCGKIVIKILDILTFKKQGLLKRRHGTQQIDIQHNDTQHNDTQHNDTQHNDTQHNDTQHNDTQHNDTQHNNKNATLRLNGTKNCYSECHLC